MLASTEECLSCHNSYRTYFSTAHYLTSRAASRDSILGKFDDVLKTSEPELYYRLEARSDGFFQTAIVGSFPTISRRFDLVIGSGRKGQTYLYWDKSDQLYQLPVSFWTELNTWVHSPGYDDKVVNFSRPVLPRCLECHASTFEASGDSTSGNRYNRSNFVLGISCEKCHGSGVEHVTLQNNKAQKPVDQLIVNPAKLSRDRQLDLCALCHGGLGSAKAPAFSYKAGDDLEKYLHLVMPGPNEPVDVHGNQLALLERSKCFKSSDMTCSTCHDVHAAQRNPTYFSDKCLQCHKVQSCGLFKTRGRAIAGKCVDCHLPNQNSNVIVSSHDRVRITPKVRNHWIKVYR